MVTERVMEESELRGGRAPYRNMLSEREMKSLTAVCDTLLPSLDVSQLKDESLKTFYRTSASMLGVPEHVGGMLSSRIHHPQKGLLRWGLWLLSTWYGTLFLSGTKSMSRQFPYFRSFPSVPSHVREEILLSWSLSSFFLFNMLFKCLKYIALRSFFTLVNEKSENPSWKALGYCGPDPNFVNQEEDLLSPLSESIVDWGNPTEVIFETLQKKGFQVTTTSPSSTPSATIHCDAVVVGSGSGGGVIAGVLAKAGYKVVVLEKGEYYPKNRLSLLEGPTLDNMYDGSGFMATDDVGVVVLAGSTLGGGSTINWSASLRTPNHVVDEWRYVHGLHDPFGGKAYDRALDAVCDRMGVQSNVDEEGLNNAVLRSGCIKLGYPVMHVPCNAPRDHYCGWCHLGCKDGRKKGTAETWLADMAESGNGVIFPKCEALRVVHEKAEGRIKGRKARGVVFKHENHATFLVESKVTVVACGALRTPGLLKRSGLKNKNIGRNLRLHPVVMAWGYFPPTTTTEEVKGMKKNCYEGGIITSMSTVVSNFETTGYGAVIQTPSLHPGLFSVMMPWMSGADFKDRMTRFSRTVHVFALARDGGEGGAVDLARGTMTYELDEREEVSLQRGLEKMLRILVAAGAEEIGTHHFTGERLMNVKKASEDELERFVKEVSGKKLRNWSAQICSAHQMGSCRMGVEVGRSAVDQRGETWEVEGLFVGDASVLPTALGVNPMVTVQAIAYCTAQSVLDVLRSAG
ncbi:Long-chain-alcohol oxidase FAO4A [Acorus gramineus]|uniref:Long-chain-alcohol oxidase n=1 Tax=Acorus gramineus TaxID=55184 RepID=A0AAV9AEC4_ACOGR|nr:Long-chain-alcohol oxidase FAO4A [Acorus gramineus]